MANTLKFGNGEWYGKKDTILAYNDENSNYKPLPFDFSRASSATVINKDGLIETVGSGQPRIDYKDDSKGALKLEPSRTNLITNSNSNNLGFALDSVSMTYNSITSPDGENNGILFKQTGNNASNSAYNFGLTTTNGTYTYSIFIKANDSEKMRIYSSNGSAITQDFNPQEMTEGVLNGALNLKFESYGNDWFRVSFTRTLSSASHHRFSIYPDRNNTQKSVYIFGLQIEVGSYATSYIPTQGSTVTRLADVCNQTVPDGVIGQTEGVLYCEVDVKSGYDTNNLIVTLSDGTNLKQIYINRSNGKLEFFVGTNVNELLYVTPSILTNGVHKLALAYKQNDFAVAIDGVIAHTDNSGNVPTCNKINVGSHYNGSLPFNDRINDIKLYNTRLSDSELQALTS